MIFEGIQSNWIWFFQVIAFLFLIVTTKRPLTYLMWIHFRKVPVVKRCNSICHFFSPLQMLIIYETFILLPADGLKLIAAEVAMLTLAFRKLSSAVK